MSDGRYIRCGAGDSVVCDDGKNPDGVAAWIDKHRRCKPTPGTFGAIHAEPGWFEIYRIVFVLGVGGERAVDRVYTRQP